MKKLSYSSKINILLLVIHISIFFVGFILKDKKLWRLSLIFLAKIFYNIKNDIKKGNFFDELIDYDFDSQKLDLIKDKLLLDIDRENLRKDLIVLEPFYANDLSKIDFNYLKKFKNVEILDQKYFINNKNTSIMSFILSNNILFLSSLEECNFIKAYFYLKKICFISLDLSKKSTELEFNSSDIIHQTINGEFILFYLLNYKNEDIVKDIIAILFSFDKNIGERYIKSLNLDIKNINYLLDILKTGDGLIILDIILSNFKMLDVKIYKNIKQNIKRYENIYSKKVIINLKRAQNIYTDLEENNITLKEIDIRELSKLKILFKNIKLGGYYLDFLVKNLLFLIYLERKNFRLAYFYFKKTIKHVEIQKNQFHAAPITGEEIFYQHIEKESILSFLSRHKDNKYARKIIIKLFKFDKNISKEFLKSLDLEDEELNNVLDVLYDV